MDLDLNIVVVMYVVWVAYIFSFRQYSFTKGLLYDLVNSHSHKVPQYYLTMWSHMC